MIFENSSKQIRNNAGYDQIALSYKIIYEQRRTYLNAIDSIVIPYLKRRTVLDIGSGDGREYQIYISLQI